MSFPAYERYKDSGIDWCAELPAGWTVRRLRTLVEIRKRIAGSEGFDVLSITQRGIKVRDVESNDGQLAESYAHYQFVEPGDFAMNQMDLVTGWIDISDRRGVTSPDYRVFAVHDPAQVCPRYLLRVLQNSYSSKVFYAYGQGASHLGRWRLPTDAFQEFAVPLPGMGEQHAIAAFLDRETAKIDVLVEAQRRLIELLKEKRQAVISRAVTKGLDPSAPMKDSGVEWLGQVPAHWGVRPLKHLVSLRSGGTPSKEREDYWSGEIPWASAKDLKSDYLSDTQDHLSQEAVDDGAASLTPAGSVLVLVRGMMLARFFPVSQTEVPMAINQDLKALVGKADIENSFLAWLLRGTERETLNRLDEAGHGTKALRMEAWLSMPLPVPPETEQRQIVPALEAELAAIDALSARAVTAVALFQERRAALIAAAVTGKIDVRAQKPIVAIDRDRVRLVVAAVVVERLAHRQNFGRVKLQKLIYLAETHVGIDELGGNYLRAAAGPLDRTMIEQMEVWLEQSGGFAVSQVDGKGGQVSYRVLGARGAFRDEAQTVLKEREAQLTALIDTFADLDTKSTEAVATLYAAWNDLLQDGAAVSDDAVVSEVLHNWHPEKAQKFKKAELMTWLQWMRRRKLTPRGAGPRTTTGRLFI